MKTKREALIEYLKSTLTECEVLDETTLHMIREEGGEIAEYKYCPHCGEWHLLNDYYANNSTQDQLQSWCKKCLKEANLNRKQEVVELQQTKDMEEEEMVGCEEEMTPYDEFMWLLEKVRLRDEERKKEIAKLKKELKEQKNMGVDIECLTEREIEQVLKSNKIAPRLLFEAIARQEERYVFYAIDKVSGLRMPIRMEEAIA